ncbi:MAG TPA: hypothetical protein VFT29_08410 [Gemmatimonadaceae bacterium]|nr:hypothetical protein [Gemmatimonadaceae bacterium]
MQGSVRLSLVTLSIVSVLAACAGSDKTDATAKDDFKRDLQLASTTVDFATPKVDPSLLTSLETKPINAPQKTKTVKKGPGPRAVHSETPTVKSDPLMEIAAVDDESEQTTVVDKAPVPEPTNEPVAVAPRPTPAPVVLPVGNDGGDYGTSGNGGGIFGPVGRGGGVIIRGGGVDGDHCEIHARGPRRGGWYYPNTGVSRIPQAAPRYTPPQVSRSRLIITARGRGR